MAAHIDKLRRLGDSCGRFCELSLKAHLLVGGSRFFDRLDADIAKALMSINAVKGVEIGAGFRPPYNWAANTAMT